MRIGIGFDIHRLVSGRPLILGGILIPSELGLEGHSDADVVVHAIMDAILGSLSLGDLGDHFPDSDERYRGISSMELLQCVMGLVAARRYRVSNVDVMVLAEVPKLAPFKAKMIEELSTVLHVGQRDVSIKATTMERLGTIGRREGIAAQAVVMMKPMTRIRRGIR